MYLFIFLLLFILCYRFRFSGPEHFQEDHFSKYYELPIRGFFTIVIVFHHLSQYLLHPGPFVLFREVGILCVAVFFFYSGYGLMKNVMTNPDYFKYFFLRRYTKIFVPFFLCNIIYLTAYTILGKRYGLKLSLEYLLGLRLINSQAWYIIVIALFYLIFFIAFRVVKIRWLGLLIMTAFQIIFPTYCMMKGPGIYWFQGEWWFSSSSLFLIGLLMARFEKQIMCITRKWYYLLLPVSAIGFLYFFPESVQVLDQIEPLLLNEHIFVKEMIGNWICFLWQTMAVISFNITLFLLTLKLRFSNRILEFLGVRSFELYLIHGLFLEILRGDLIYIKSDFVYVLVSVTLSIAASAILYFPFKYISGKFQKRAFTLFYK